MRIWFVSNYLTKHHKFVGGAEQATYSILKLLEKDGKNVGVFFTKKDFDVNEFNSVEIKTIETRLPESLKRTVKAMKILGVFYDKLTFFHALKAYEKVRPDVLNFQNFNVLSFPMLWAAKLMGIPTVFSVYDFWCVCPAGTLIDSGGKRCRIFNSTLCDKCDFVPPEFGLFKTLGLSKLFLFMRQRLFRLFLNQFDAFIVLSNFWIDLLTEYGIPKEKINVIPLPIEGKISVKKNRRVERDSILFVGFIHPRKGAFIVIKAMKKVLKQFPKSKLYVIGPTGSERYKRMIEEYILDNRLEKNVKLLGRMSHQEVLDFMQTMEIITVPEQWEIAWPIALTEAMAVAKPTVSSNIGGIPDFIDNNGFLADPTDSNHFAEKIIWLLKNKNKAKKMGMKARKDILKITDEKSLVNKLMNLYKSLL